MGSPMSRSVGESNLVRINRVSDKGGDLSMNVCLVLWTREPSVEDPTGGSLGVEYQEYGDISGEGVTHLS